jgi:hypothetical protein
VPENLSSDFSALGSWATPTGCARQFFREEADTDVSSELNISLVDPLVGQNRRKNVGAPDGRALPHSPNICMWLGWIHQFSLAKVVARPGIQ